MCLNQNKLTSQAKNHEQTKIIKWLNIEKMYNMIYLYRFLTLIYGLQGICIKKGAQSPQVFKGSTLSWGTLRQLVGHWKLLEVSSPFILYTFICSLYFCKLYYLENYHLASVSLYIVILQTVILHTVFLQIVISRLTCDWCFFFVLVGG